MKIGIVTIYDLNNYGNRLQNYAIIKYMQQQNIKAETLIIEQYNIVKLFKNIIRKVFKKKIYKHWNLIQECNISNKQWDEARIRRYYAFYDFSYKYTNIIHTHYWEEFPLTIANRYDFFVAGSDQIWNSYIGQATSWEFLSFANSNKKLSWAASFGLDKIPEEKKKYYSKHLRSFKNISVREKSGAKIIKELIDKDAEVLIDPTLMLDADQWREIAKKSRGRKKNEKYILKYFLGKQVDENIDYIKTIAEKKGYEIYELMDKNQPLIYEAGPSEFIDLIDHAELICTDSFHACVFSILFDKPFLVFDRDGNGAGMGSRISTLLLTLGLERKMPGCVDEDNIFEHDYTNTYKRLETERKKALDFLKRSLRLEDED